MGRSAVTLLSRHWPAGSLALAAGAVLLLAWAFPQWPGDRWLLLTLQRTDNRIVLFEQSRNVRSRRPDKGVWMNYIDVIVLGIWGLAALWGFFKGLVQMVVPLVVVVAGLALTSRLAEPVGNLFARFTQSENLQTILGYAVIVFGLIIVATVLSMVLKFMLKFIPLAGLADRLGGALVGILVGFILLSGALVALQKFPVGDAKADIDASVVGNALADRFSVVISAFGLIPDDWRSQAEDLKDKVREVVPPQVPGAPKSPK